MWEVDCLRGLAVCMMLASNFLFDLYYFTAIVDSKSGFLVWFSRATAGLFVLVVGISLTLSAGRSQNGFVRKNAIRGLKILCLGLVITAVTKAAVGNAYIVFGILHLIGISIFMALPFVRYRYLNLVAGIAIVLAGVWASGIRVNHSWLLWLGFQYAGFASVDYTPLLPWFGFVLIGLFLGNTMFSSGNSGWMGAKVATSAIFRFLSLTGRHSLLIYFVHQPIFWGGFLVGRRFGLI